MKEQIQKYYIEQDYNCAETTLRILRDRYALPISEESMKLVSGFGGGCGCGIICGALAGAISGLGCMMVTQRAHTTEGFKECCGAFSKEFEKSLGATDCAAIRPKYFQEGVRCAQVLERTLESFDAFTAEKGLGSKE